MKFFANKKALSATYATFFGFFLFFTIPIGGVFFTLNDGDTFIKLSQIISNKPTEISHAAGQFRGAFYFLIFMCLLTGFMYLLTAKSREIGFRFFTIAFGVYTIVAFGYKVIINSAMVAAIDKLDPGPLKESAPEVTKAFVSNFLIFALAGSALSIVALLIGLLGKGNQES